MYVQSFLAESEGKMTELVELYSNMKQDFKQVVLFFGEDPTKMRIDDFFSIFASFMTDFEVYITCIHPLAIPYTQSYSTILW